MISRTFLKTANPLIFIDIALLIHTYSRGWGSPAISKLSSCQTTVSPSMINECNILKFRILQAVPLYSSGFQPLMVTHEASQKAPQVSSGPQIRPMLDPFSSMAANGRLKARISAALAGPSAR